MTAFALGLLWLFQASGPARPPITGIAKVSITTTDADATRAFYTRILGLRAGDGCSPGNDGCYLVNDSQRIEVYTAPGTRPWDPISEIAFATPDLAGMRAYLLAHHARALGRLERDAAGRPWFRLLDPAGTALAFVEPPALPRFGLSVEEPVATRLLHVGFAVFDRKEADAFYRDVLGFRMYWQGGAKDADTDWVQLEVPDGSDAIEYTLNADPESGIDQLSVSNHLALGVAEVGPAVGRLRARGLATPAQLPSVATGSGTWNCATPRTSASSSWSSRPSSRRAVIRTRQLIRSPEADRGTGQRPRARGKRVRRPASASRIT